MFASPLPMYGELPPGQLPGIVSLRISRSRFPWPPLAETVTEAVGRLLADAGI